MSLQRKKMVGSTGGWEKGQELFHTGIHLGKLRGKINEIFQVKETLWAA